LLAKDHHCFHPCVRYSVQEILYFFQQVQPVKVFFRALFLTKACDF
jgi:hypothetical protein